MYPARDILQHVIKACWIVTWQKAGKTLPGPATGCQFSFSWMNATTSRSLTLKSNDYQTSVTPSPAARVPLLCFYHKTTSTVIYYWTDARQHGICLSSRPWQIVGFAWAQESSSLWPDYRLHLLLSYMGLKNERATPLCVAKAFSQTSSFLDRFSSEFWISNKSYITVINHPVLPWYVYSLIIKMVCFWLLFFKVNVVSFNTEASTDGGSDVTSCFSERLALAVPENKKSLEKYIDGPKFIAQRKSIVIVMSFYFQYRVIPQQAP